MKSCYVVKSNAIRSFFLENLWLAVARRFAYDFFWPLDGSTLFELGNATRTLKQILKNILSNFSLIIIKCNFKEFDPIVMMSYLHNVKLSHVKMSLFVVCLWNNIYIRLGI